jgi:hypothetical protein
MHAQGAYCTSGQASHIAYSHCTVQPPFLALPATCWILRASRTAVLNASVTLVPS